MASGRAFFIFLTTLLTSGCDIVQGFRDASDAVFPSEMTYLDAPGYHLVEGEYRRLDFTAGSELYLLVRSSQSDDTALYAMRYSDPEPCAIPNVGRFQGADGEFKGPAMIAFYDRQANDGVLHFADGTCKVYALTIPDGSLPILELEQGFVVTRNSEFLLVNPVAGTVQSIVTGVEDWHLNAFAGLSVLRVDGQLQLFRSDWRSEKRFGDKVVREQGIGDAFYFEDSTGIHRLTSSGGQEPEISDELIGPGGSELNFAPGIGGTESWITFLSSSGNSGKLTAYGHRSEHASDLGLPSDVRNVALLPAWPKTDGDPEVDPFFVFYLRDLEDEPQTLFVRKPDKSELKLGSRAPLGRLTALTTETGTHGYALVDDSEGVGRFRWWDATNDSTLDLANRVLSDTGDIILDPDLEARVGDFALPNGPRLSVVARRVPYNRVSFRDSKDRWSALFDQSDGSTARLSITTSSLDFSEAASATTPPAAPEFSVIAEGVVIDGRTRFLASLPGIAFFTNRDSERNTGRLQYRNLQLGFTAIVNDGVSDYIPTSDSIIYTIPFGQSAGIWVVRAR